MGARDKGLGAASVPAAAPCGADATKRVPPDLRPSTFDFPGIPMPQSGLPNLPGSGHGRAAGMAAHEACFGAAADTPLNARRASLAVSKVRRGSALSRFVTTHFPQFSLKSHLVVVSKWQNFCNKIFAIALWRRGFETDAIHQADPTVGAFSTRHLARRIPIVCLVMRYASPHHEPP